MNSRRVNVVATAVLLLSLAGTVMTLRTLDGMRRGATLREVLYFRSPKMLRRMSLGYSGLVADLYWTRAVQYFGSHHIAQASDFHLLSPLLEMTTDLDPKMTVAYQFGSNFLAPAPPNGAGEPEKAVALVEHGIQHNPDNWKLYYALGFIYYMDLKDYKKAAETFERGAAVPKAHPFLRLLAAQMAQHAGEYGMSRMLWTATYETTTQEQIRRNAIDHLLALRVDEDVTQLERIVGSYRERTGQLPSSINDLVRAGLIGGMPVDPTGQPYKLTPDGRIELRNPDAILYITKGLPPGHRSPQPKPEPTPPSGK
ncbi:MAG TPA: hypothetical protein VLT90_01765 [Terriglobales bacterium]|nr:hypothetical protein [Terriglobales bacterium]